MKTNKYICTFVHVKEISISNYSETYKKVIIEAINKKCAKFKLFRLYKAVKHLNIK